MSSSSFPNDPDSPIPTSSSQSFLQLLSLFSALRTPPSYPREAQPTARTIRYLNVKDSDVESDETLWDLYERWMAHCEVSRSLDEKKKRFVAFKENVKFIQLENKTDNFPYELQLNNYSDMTIEEHEIKHTAVSTVRFKHLDIKDSDLKSDKTLQHLYKLWMTRYGASRSPNEKLKRFAVFKQQVQFIHSQNKKENNIYKLGLNQFSDMTSEEFESKHMGASPTNMLKLYNKIMEGGGILSEGDYNQGKMDGPRVTLDGYGMVPVNDEDALEEAINRHPICAFVDSRGDAFKNYRGGVLTEEQGKEVNLTVTITGFGVTPNGIKFWEFLNCWGPKWGEGGFMRIKRGVNLCGIASFATFPVINKPSVEAYCTRG